MDTALREIESDLPEACPTAQLVDYDFSTPFTPLVGITVQSPVQPRPRWGPAVQADLIQSHPSCSHIPIGENISQVQKNVSKASPFGHASKSSLTPGQYTPEEPQNTCKASVDRRLSQASAQQLNRSGSITDHKQESVASMPKQETEMGILESKSIDPSKEDGVDTAPCTTQEQGLNNGDQKVMTDGGTVKPLEAGPQDHTSDAQDKADENVSLTKILSHVSSADLKVGAIISDVAAPQPSPSIHGHSSDAHIKVGQFVSEVTAPLPSPNIHGHASDSHIKIGEHVSEVDVPLPSPSVHGHPSDAHIKIGENVSEFVASLPAPNVHGHASDAHIKVGELVPDAVAPLPTPSIHGHASDANIKVGEFVSNVPEARPRWNKHGHASDCTLQTGCVVSGAEPTLSPLPGSSHGHSSDSTLGIGCVVLGDEPKRSPLPGSFYGHSSDSNLGIGCVVSKAEPLPSPLPGSTYGHSSDSTLGVGCVVLGTELQPSALPGSAFGHSSDSSLGIGCVVKSKGSGDPQKTEATGDGQGRGYTQHILQL